MKSLIVHISGKHFAMLFPFVLSLWCCCLLLNTSSFILMVCSHLDECQSQLDMHQNSIFCKRKNAWDTQMHKMYHIKGRTYFLIDVKCLPCLNVMREWHRIKLFFFNANLFLTWCGYPWLVSARFYIDFTCQPNAWKVFGVNAPLVFMKISASNR